MNVFKKICSIFLIAAVILSLFACIAYSGVFAASGPAIIVETVKGKANTTASLKVDFCGNGTDVKGIAFKIKYDNENLTAKEPEISLPEGIFESHNTNYSQNEMYVLLYGYKVFEDGTVATLKFDLPQTVKGSKEFDIAVTECLFSDGTSIVGAATSGKATAILYGDINADGVVDGTDDLRLTKYLLNLNPQTGESTVDIDILAADVAYDGVVDGTDDLRFTKYLLNLDPQTGQSSVPLGPQ